MCFGLVCRSLAGASLDCKHTSIPGLVQCGSRLLLTALVAHWRHPSRGHAPRALQIIWPSLMCMRILQERPQIDKGDLAAVGPGAFHQGRASPRRREALRR